MNSYLKNTYFGIIIIGCLTLIFSSCNDDDKVSWSGKNLTNVALKTILIEKGYNFNEAGQIEQDDKVKNTTALDLSGYKLNDISGLDVFSNLEDVDLSDNDFPISFDFSVLPSSVNSVNLTGNTIYEYTGLVNVETEENGDEKISVLRNLKKLYLPKSAKYDTQELPVFYKQYKNDIENNNIDMKMVNDSGSLKKYDALRSIPDDSLRSVMKNYFPALFKGDKVDLTAKITKLNEVNNNVNIFQTLNIENADGIQYIFAHRSYKGSYITIRTTKETTIPFFKIYYGNVYEIELKNINTPNGIDLTIDSTLCSFKMANNPQITCLNLSDSKLMGQRGIIELTSTVNSIIYLENCPLLEDLTLFPKNASTLFSLDLYNLPKIDNINISQLDALQELGLGKFTNGCDITYLSPKKWFVWGYQNYFETYENDSSYMFFGITEDIYEKASTKKFLDTYSTRLKTGGINTFNDKITSFNWTKYYDHWIIPALRK